jgi:ABC-2 type transport system ATP-binding protein
MDIIKVKNLGKEYYQYRVFRKGKLMTHALKDVSFSVKKGDFFGLLGKNGAGKSTTMKILTTNLEKTKGKVFVNGYDLDEEENEIKNSISWMFGVDYSGIGWSSLENNLKLAASFLGLSKEKAQRQVTELLHYFGLYKYRKLDVWRLSTGMQGKYSLCVAMLKNPEVLFLDEPLSGLDFEAKEQLRHLLTELNDKGTTIVYTDQQLREVEKLCKNVVVIDHGMKMYEGSVARLKEMYRDADVVDLRCRSGNINSILQDLKKKNSFISDVEIVESRDNIHTIKLLTKVDGTKALMPIGKFLTEKGVVIEQLNAGMLDLEDVFKKFLRKDKKQDEAQRLLNYSVTGEKPSRDEADHLKHSSAKVRGAAVRAFMGHRDVERILTDMLTLTKDMKIESLKVIGDKKLHHLAERLREEARGKERDIDLHLALAMGKLGDIHVVDTLISLLLQYPTCYEVLEHVPRLDQEVIHQLRDRLHTLPKREIAFVIYQIKKMPDAPSLLDLLHLREHQGRKTRRSILSSLR